ncbi:MAG TPA: Mth938-like domain-containing protein [Caulobacteraceae bacterium]|nr:Mth938-like domain-containing protein [Caulobacteraceae bacterium]
MAAAPPPMRQPPSIDAYGAGGFRVSGVRREGSLLIAQDEIRRWRPAALAEVEVADFDAVFQLGPREVEFVLLGVGPKPAPPPAAVRQALQAAGIGLEVMDTPAACRTYNVLAGEGRRVALALIAI